MIDHFFDHPDYIAGIVERINGVLYQLPNPEEVHLVFSAHGLPLTLVEKGDPYPQHIQSTVRLVCEMGAWENRMCSASRAKWARKSGCSLRSPEPSSAWLATASSACW